VLLLAGAESIGGEYLSARVRRALWIMCIFLMMMPQPNFPFQLFAIDFTAYYDRMMSAAGILPREIAGLVGDIRIVRAARDYSVSVTGLAYQNYPYLLGIILMIVPALFLLLGGYLRCRKRTKSFGAVTDERILRIWDKVRQNSRRTPLLLDSGDTPHPPVLFGFFRQKLLLPVAYFQKLSDDDLELILTHEYIHYRSGDGIVNILTLCLWPFCWYNPFFLAARRRLRINCELACDAEVLKRFPEKTAEYGKLLLEFAGTAKPPEVTMAFREYAHELRSRIIYMTELPHRRKSSLLVTFGLALALAAPFGLVSAITREKKEDNVSAVFQMEQKSVPSVLYRQRPFLQPLLNSKQCCVFAPYFAAPCPMHSNEPHSFRPEP
jgi:bla regulator protein BlaR1